jgi:NAD(P)-dependent dehydrogenase (short-subunit alcohol dehydrogenase family)
MTGNAAFELARLGIRVNAVYPGLIKTPMIERVKELIFSLESGHRAPSWMNGRHHG